MGVFWGWGQVRVLYSTAAATGPVLQNLQLPVTNEKPLKVGPITPACGDRDPVFLFLKPTGVSTGMSIPTFKEYVAMREGVLSATRPPLKGMSRINTLPITNAQRKRLHTKPGQSPSPFKPTVRAVAEIVPQATIPKLKPRLPQRSSFGLAAGPWVWP